MQESLKQDLESLTCEGNVAKLPTSPLNNYPALKKTLTKANGKYNKNTFVFPNEAQEVVDTLLGGTVVNFKKEFQFFATPIDVIAKMLSHLKEGVMVHRILEPSAGHGDLIDHTLLRHPESGVVAVELSELNTSVLIEKYSPSPKDIFIIKDDFLKVDPAELGQFDLVIANPPFTKNQDIDHIMKMYGLVAPGGQLITIASKSWTFGSQKKQVAFREFVEENASVQEELGAGAFKESGTNVSTMLLVFNKKTGAKN